MPFPKSYRFLPYLIFFSFMKPDHYLHWTALGLLIFLLQNKEEWNLRVLPCMALALLPSLYLSQISWSLALSVLLSYPLGIKPHWIQTRQLWVIAPIVLSLLAFFPGPLAPWVFLLSLILFLPRKKATLGALVFLLLLALPLGRSDWKSWLGQVPPPPTQVLTPSQPLPNDTPPPSTTPPSSPMLSASLIEQILITAFQWLLFLMFALLLLVLFRLLWVIRRNKKPFIHGILLFFLMLLTAGSGIFLFRWLAQILAQRTFADPTLLPLLNTPNQSLPLPGVQAPPLPDLPSELPPEAIPQAFPLREVISYAFTILFLLLLCFMLFKALRYLWHIPTLSDSAASPEEKAEDPVASPSPDWSSFQGEDLVKKGYEALRKDLYPAYPHLTPFELEQRQSGEEFRHITQAYISVSYAGVKPKVSDQIFLQWLKKCFNKI